MEDVRNRWVCEESKVLEGDGETPFDSWAGEVSNLFANASMISEMTK